METDVPYIMQEAEKAEAKAFVEKTLADNPDFKKKSALRKFFSKKAD